MCKFVTSLYLSQVKDVYGENMRVLMCMNYSSIKLSKINSIVTDLKVRYAGLKKLLLFLKS